LTPRLRRDAREQATSHHVGSTPATVMTPLPIAHPGHWFDGALYLAPVVILVVVLFFQGRGGEGAESDQVEAAGSSRPA
jgi:hypothetical protein